MKTKPTLKIILSGLCFALLSCGTSEKEIPGETPFENNSGLPDSVLKIVLQMEEEKHDQWNQAIGCEHLGHPEDYDFCLYFADVITLRKSTTFCLLLKDSFLYSHTKKLDSLDAMNFIMTNTLIHIGEKRPINYTTVYKQHDLRVLDSLKQHLKDAQFLTQKSIGNCRREMIGLNIYVGGKYLYGVSDWDSGSAMAGVAQYLKDSLAN